MKRRDALKGIIGLGIGSAGMLSGPSLFQLQKAYSITGKKLVIIFQRGGCDGINTCIPYGDDEYYTLRPTIAVARPDGSNPHSALDLDGYFGLHPGLADLHALYNDGALAIMPAVHYPSASHSHFDSQHFIESGARSKSIEGWLNRYLQTNNQSGAMRAIGIGNDVPQSLRGIVPVSSFRYLDNFRLNLPPEDEIDILDNLTQTYGQAPESRPYRQLLKHYGKTLVNDLSIVKNLDPSSYTPENGAIYSASPLAKQLKETAYLLKSNASTEIVTLSTGGWDTHSNQGGGEEDGYQTARHKNFSSSIAAFYKDLGAMTEDIVILTCTEFGRTAKENASGGTDHGNASTWFALGGGIQGGIYGEYPGLAPDQLYHGRNLDFSIDYRNIFGDILSQHLGNNALATILPGHDYSPVGLFSNAN